MILLYNQQQCLLEDNEEKIDIEYNALCLLATEEGECQFKNYVGNPNANILDESLLKDLSEDSLITEK